VKRWYDVQGPTFHAMHHYCTGLMSTNRAVFLATNAQTKAAYLQSSIREFDYVIDRAPRDFILLPEILTKKGENLIRLGEGPTGAMHLSRAIDLKPDYWPPYAALSDYYKQVGELSNARDLLRKALSFAPQVAGLKRRLADLDRTHSK
jgi:Flp pilus assembly protein TadD